MGLGLGIAILHSPAALRERIGVDDPPYSAVPNPNKQNQGDFESVKAFSKQPVGFFKGRKPLWWAWWLVRVGCVVAVIVTFIVLLNNFYFYRKSCNWCKHLSCLVSCFLSPCTTKTLIDRNSPSRTGATKATSNSQRRRPSVISSASTASPRPTWARCPCPNLQSITVPWSWSGSLFTFLLCKFPGLLTALPMNA